MSFTENFDKETANQSTPLTTRHRISQAFRLSNLKALLQQLAKESNSDDGIRYYERPLVGAVLSPPEASAVEKGCSKLLVKVTDIASNPRTGNDQPAVPQVMERSNTSSIPITFVTAADSPDVPSRDSFASDSSSQRKVRFAHIVTEMHFPDNDDRRPIWMSYRGHDDEDSESPAVPYLHRFLDQQQRLKPTLRQRIEARLIAYLLKRTEQPQTLQRINKKSNYKARRRH